jgi:hypothetical protein
MCLGIHQAGRNFLVLNLLKREPYSRAFMRTKIPIDTASDFYACVQ